MIEEGALLAGLHTFYKVVSFCLSQVSFVKAEVAQTVYVFAVQSSAALQRGWKDVCV